MDTSNFKSQIQIFKSSVLKLYTSLSPERVIIFWALLVIGFLFLFAALVTFNYRFLIKVPTYGGELHEGIIGTPRFINPVLASSEQDEDMTSLVFAGLTKIGSDGNVILDMAERIDKSEDGLRYVVTIKDQAHFHDGEKVS